MNFNKLFLKHCEKNKYEINQNQLDIVNNLKDYFEDNFQQNFLRKIFKKKNNRLGFYLMGDVGVGKTMILNFFFELLNEKKLRLHFNEFMIKFHNFMFTNKDKDNALDLFVKDISAKTKLIYFDEFQVTNIVDAMILGRLFKKILKEKIKVMFTSNIKINDLYKDGLQRDLFVPFIEILKNNFHEQELLIEDDYRINKNKNLSRFLCPLNQSNNFIFNKFFRKITKNKTKTIKTLEVKGRKVNIENFYDRIAKFNFNELCDRNLGSEDYIAIANNCDFIFIQNLPNFNENNSNQQQRFITLIDIIYEKKIPLMITSHTNLDIINSSKILFKPFKRTISRIYELTSINCR